MTFKGEELSYIFTIFNVSITISTLIYLIIKRNVFPYSNISPMWVIITLISKKSFFKFYLGICLNQICAQIGYFINKDSTEVNPPNILLERINLLLIRNLVIIPLLVRVYCLGESIKYNYLHITRKFYDDNFQEDNDDQFRKKYYARNFNYFGMFILPLAIVYVIILILISIPFTNCAINAFIHAGYPYKIQSCADSPITGEDIAYEITGTAMFNAFLMLEVCVFLTLLYRVCKYPIDNDKFLLKFEFISLFIIWTCSHNLLLGISYMLDVGFDIRYHFYINTFRNMAIALVYVYVTYKRKNITSKEIKDLMKDFDSFMYCHVSFTFFRDYIKSCHQEDYKLLSFWIEYHLYKRQTNQFQEHIHQMYLKAEDHRQIVSDNNTVNISLSTQERHIVYEMEDQLREMAEHIFNDYFVSQNRSNTNSPLTTSGFMSIEFPVDIYEKIEDANRMSFNVENIIEIFDEAHRYVTTKLFNLFSLFCRNEKQYEKLERVLFFIDFYEIKRIAI